MPAGGDDRKKILSTNNRNNSQPRSLTVAIVLGMACCMAVVPTGQAALWDAAKPEGNVHHTL